MFEILIALEILATLFAAWGIIHEDKLIRWERRTWFRLRRKIRRALRPLVNREDEAWRA